MVISPISYSGRRPNNQDICLRKKSHKTPKHRLRRIKHGAAWILALGREYVFNLSLCRMRKAEPGLAAELLPIRETPCSCSLSLVHPWNIKYPSLRSACTFYYFSFAKLLELFAFSNNFLPTILIINFNSAEIENSYFFNAHRTVGLALEAFIDGKECKRISST